MRQSKIKSLFLLISIIFCQNVFGQYIPYCQKGKWGFAIKSGKIIIPCVYEEAGFFGFVDNLAKVKKMEKYGYINKKGETVIPFKYDDCVRVCETLGTNFDEEDVKNNQFIVSQNHKYGVVILMKGVPKTLIPVNYSKIQFDSDKKIFHCTDNENTLCFNIAGQRLTQAQISKTEIREHTSAYIGISDERPIVISLNGKVGAIQRKHSGQYDTIVPMIYDDIITDKSNDYYSSHRAIFGVKTGKSWGILGILDRKKNILLPIQYDSINFELSKHYDHTFAYPRIIVVKKNNQWGIIGKKNDDTDILTTLVPFTYEAISSIQYKYLLLEKEGRFHIYNFEKTSLISNKSYSSIAECKYGSVNGFVIFQTANKLGQIVYIGENGVDFFTD